LGLDTEDTVAEFTDHTGKNRTKASNKVCVYAPRFSSVRTVSQPHEGLNLNRVVNTNTSSGINGLHNQAKLNHHVKRDSTGKIHVRSRASGFENELLSDNVSQSDGLAVHDKLINVFQDLNFVRFGTANQADLAKLNQGIQAGLTWTRQESPVIAAKTDSALEGVYEAHVATIVGVDDEKSAEPGKLRVVKLADKSVAQSGDVIEFTLRYDNLGPNPVHEVRIVDNLTPRLAYIEGSATSDRPAELQVEDNSEGSVVLTWEFTESLTPKSGGVITFKATVR